MIINCPKCHQALNINGTSGVFGVSFDRYFIMFSVRAVAKPARVVLIIVYNGLVSSTPAGSSPYVNPSQIPPNPYYTSPAQSFQQPSMYSPNPYAPSSSMKLPNIPPVVRSMDPVINAFNTVSLGG